MRLDSEYIVYVDESGDHGMQNMQETYPVFVLAFCVFRKTEYSHFVVPAIQDFKFEHFGHDIVVLHEREIRKSTGDFTFLFDQERREHFMNGLNAIVESSPFTLFATVIRKDKLRDIQATESPNPYHWAIGCGIRRVYRFLIDRKQADRQTHVIVESRGKREDKELGAEFEKVCMPTDDTQALPLKLIFAHKQINSSGLQFSDILARPIGKKVLNPEQPNRAYDILEAKFARSSDGEVDGWGLKVYP